MWWERLRKEVLDTELYSRSGTEVGVSEGVLALEEKDGDYVVKKLSDKDIPEAAYRASSDRITNYPALNEFVFGKHPDSWLVGSYKKIYVGHVTDESVRRNSSSGGILSGTQLYLLAKGKIDGAVTLRMRRDVPYLTEPVIARTPMEILEGAQSKYTVAPVNQVLAELGDFRSVAYTGLPEQIASVRKLQHMKHASVSNVSYVLGMFYGETLGFGAVRSLLRANGVSSPDQIKRLAFRAGEWPGHLRIDLKDGRAITVPKFYANYLSPSHITPYSLWQADYMAELADISCGDAWAPVYEERGKGWSVVLARTQKGLELLEEMRAAGVVSLTEITEQELVNMHSLGLDVKKRGTFLRIERRRKKGLPVPEFGYEPVNIDVKRRAFEAFFGFVIWFFHLRATIWLLENIPVAVIGKAFVYARKVWKKSTKTTKASGLDTLRFRLTELPPDAL